jgi:hypothetical protein
LVAEVDERQIGRTQRTRSVSCIASGFAALRFGSFVRSNPALDFQQTIPPCGHRRFLGRSSSYRVGPVFSVWGRLHLGTNWSQAVTVKEDHELITTGPYAFVRHPIYTGLLVGILGSAIAVGEWRGLLAVILAIAALWPKLRLEEKWLRAEFGEPYEAYSRKVSALLPHVI